jgi:hypothetical protein
MMLKIVFQNLDVTYRMNKMFKLKRFILNTANKHIIFNNLSLVTLKDDTCILNLFTTYNFDIPLFDISDYP